MPRGRPEPLSERDRATAPVVERVKKRLQDAGDGDLELFPATEDVYGVLLYAREHEAVLEKAVERLEAIRRPTKEERERLTAAQEALQEYNLDRLRLIRRLRQLTDVQEAAVLEACGRSRVKGKELAVILGIKSRGGAALRLERLRLAIATKWEVRTPRLAKELEARETQERRQIASGYARVREAALVLLSFRSSFLTVEDLDEWWDDLEWYLDGEDETLSAQASVVAHVRMIVLEIRQQAVLEGVPAASDEAALRALDEAAEATQRN
ncbi:hypothetical protein ABZ502_17830 [Streptomyces abikoensis]|uniref:hypothetical protein n=1 Tax=Streptomyces abikoensis TaxID=97398 RepID=UPI00340C063D